MISRMNLTRTKTKTSQKAQRRPRSLALRRSRRLSPLPRLRRTPTRRTMSSRTRWRICTSHERPRAVIMGPGCPPEASGRDSRRLCSTAPSLGAHRTPSPPSFGVGSGLHVVLLPLAPGTSGWLASSSVAVIFADSALWSRPKSAATTMSEDLTTLSRRLDFVGGTIGDVGRTALRHALGRRVQYG